MPYFRWLGPTAIMPGFKQMVVKVKRQDGDAAKSSTDGGGVLSPTLNQNKSGSSDHSRQGASSAVPAAVESEMRTPLNLPFYDTSNMPPSELITHLANTFFTHVGCNYPFLQRDRFLRDLEEKQVDAILVDAVCALAARFSTHSLLTAQASDGSKASPSDYGHAFALRAKVSLIDTFTFPTVSAVQAALLLAYNEFGESRDSGLWMYLGIAIRLVEDLGLHKLEGLRHIGRDGPTPRMVKRASIEESPVATRRGLAKPEKDDESPSQLDPIELRAIEQERFDTFWAVFFLDRVVSSGTGRRSTLRDKDIELSFPSLDEKHQGSDWPTPFPALIRIVHLYGRVADLLNTIKEPSDITTDIPKRLASMESQVTSFYQGLSPRLHFDAFNFQHYVKAGEGTNFVLLHFWFHTLIVLLHRPTLLKTFEGRTLQLFPNSLQLSMSSAKTIADILSYSQLIDSKANLGNPFTTQPIYIAACAFLKETAEQTATSNSQSRATSPGRHMSGSDVQQSPQHHSSKASSSGSSTSKPSQTTITERDHKRMARHSLLATAATQHYQLCYKALQSLETYWSGTKYILTVLDQKFEGVGDPLLYTAEEGESSLEQPKPEPSFTAPGWRRKMSWGPSSNNAIIGSNFAMPALGETPETPGPDPSKGQSYYNHHTWTTINNVIAIGWTLTGQMNSPNTNLAWHYASEAQKSRGGNGFANQPTSSAFGNSSNVTQDHARQSSKQQQMNNTAIPDMTSSTLRHQLPSYPTSNTVSNANNDASLLLNLNSPYSQNSMLPFSPGLLSDPSNPYASGSSHLMDYNNLPPTTMPDFGDMMIESQDVDMSMLGLGMMPWFDSYPAPEMMSMFDPSGQGTESGGAQQQASGATGRQGSR